MRNERGITLVALIISVTIMLILAIVVIAYALGDTGIFDNTAKAKIMNKVQALDDAIKAYSVKTDDAYSTERKTVEDLYEETFIDKNNQEQHVLDVLEIEDGKTIYAVNFDESGKVAKLLGLNPDDFKLNTQNLLKKVGSAGGHYTLSQLKDLGIYVVDHDLNAAYLCDGTTYGKLINFGVKEVIAEKTEYSSQYVKLIINNKVIGTDQEVIIVIDKTNSMAYPMSYVSKSNSFNKSAISKTFSDSRWYAVKSALDNFLEEYFKGATSTSKKSARIYSFSVDGGLKELKTTYTYTGTNKNGYEQFTTATLKSSLITDAETGKKLYCSFFTSGEATHQNPTRLEGGTNVPTTLAKIYNNVVKAAAAKDDDKQRDVILLTDGESTEYKDVDPFGKTISQKESYSLATIGKAIKDIDSGGRKVGLYAVGVSDDIQNLKRYFAGNSNSEDYTGNCDKIFEAKNSAQLINQFQTILESIQSNSEGQTSEKEQHTIINRDTRETIAYQGVETIQVVMKKTDTGESVNVIFGVGKDHELEDVYDTETGIIKLEKAWEYSGLSPSQLDLYNEKEVYITTINSGD